MADSSGGAFDWDEMQIQRRCLTKRRRRELYLLDADRRGSAQENV